MTAVNRLGRGIKVVNSRASASMAKTFKKSFLDGLIAQGEFSAVSASEDKEYSSKSMLHDDYDIISDSCIKFEELFTVIKNSFELCNISSINELDNIELTLSDLKTISNKETGFHTSGFYEGVYELETRIAIEKAKIIRAMSYLSDANPTHNF